MASGPETPQGSIPGDCREHRVARSLRPHGAGLSPDGEAHSGRSPCILHVGLENIQQSLCPLSPEGRAASPGLQAHLCSGSWGKRVGRGSHSLDTSVAPCLGRPRVSGASHGARLAHLAQESRTQGFNHHLQLTTSLSMPSGGSPGPHPLITSMLARFPLWELPASCGPCHPMLHWAPSSPSLWLPEDREDMPSRTWNRCPSLLVQ